jgi:hypothetical protein
MYEDRKGVYVSTYTGGRFYPEDPRAEDMNLTDIAHSLSMQCRFNGHTNRFYSVAQHCVLAVRELYTQNEKLPPSNQMMLTMLLHDGPEAWIGDLVRPIKMISPKFRVMEHEIATVLAQKFGLIYPYPKRVYDIDDRMQVTEMMQLLPDTAANSTHIRSLGAKPLDIKIDPWSAGEAKDAFLRLALTIMGCKAMVAAA